MTSSANSPLEDLDGLRTHVFVPGLTQIIFAELIRGSPVYDKNICKKYVYVCMITSAINAQTNNKCNCKQIWTTKKVGTNLHLKKNMK